MEIDRIHELNSPNGNQNCQLTAFVWRVLFIMSLRIFVLFLKLYLLKWNPLKTLTETIFGQSTLIIEKNKLLPTPRIHTHTHTYIYISTLSIWYLKAVFLRYVENRFWHPLISVLGDLILLS